MFLTTYQSDFVRFSPTLLQTLVSREPPAGETSALPLPWSVHTQLTVSGEPPALPLPWSVFTEDFYTTTNSTYGSFQHIPSNPTVAFRALLPQNHQQRAAETSGPLLGVGERGQLQYMFGEGKSTGSEQMKTEEAADGSTHGSAHGPTHFTLNGKTKGPLEEGVIVVSSHMGVACCDHFLESVYREAGLEHLLRFPTCSTQITCAEWESAEQWQPFREALKSTGTKLLQGTNGVWRSSDGCFQVLPSPPRPPPPPPPPPPAPPPVVRPPANMHHSDSELSKSLLSFMNNYTCDWARP